MGRRSYGFSATQINRMVSASNAARQARERQRLIDSQKGILREIEPDYFISNFDFNKESRVAHVEFLEKKYYRKIVKYVTQNGQRYPIYSDWLVKTKTIKKTIKLTNENLEDLKYNFDSLISKFSYEIVAKVGNIDFYPSWFIVDTLKCGEEVEIDTIKKEYNAINNEKKSEIKDLKSTIKKETNKKSELLSILLIHEKKQVKIERSIGKTMNKSNALLFSIITFGVYLLFHSERRLNKLKIKLDNILEIISNIKNNISNIDINIEEKNNIICKLKNEIEANNEIEKDEIFKVKVYYAEKISQVEPLPITLDESFQNDFVPLKKLAGMNYEKIIGCYVIRNVEKNKYYVGQSKDVLKRVCKQHFDGTKVKNIIFAEDYYCSKLENKDDLFEVRIIRLNTKDELDEKEKMLIEEYDSFNNGYNATSGNN